jgi:3-methyladenine DNA glycosylase AlkC
MHFNWVTCSLERIKELFNENSIQCQINAISKVKPTGVMDYIQLYNGLMEVPGCARTRRLEDV